MNQNNAELISRLRSVTAAYQRDITDLIKELENRQNVYSSDLPDLERIAEKVCQYYCIEPTDLMSRKRDAETAWARQVAIYLSAKMSKHRYDRIAAFFRRHRTMIIHCVNAVENRISTDKRAKAEVEELLNAF